MIIKAYKFWLRPNKDQERELISLLETHRRLYNECLKEFDESFQAEMATDRESILATKKRMPTNFDQNKKFTQKKKENKWYARLNTQSAQQTIGRLHASIRAFYDRIFRNKKKTGHPRPRFIRGVGSITFPTYGDGVKFISNGKEKGDKKLRITGVGQVKIRLHREIPTDAAIKTVNVKFDGERWSATFTVKINKVFQANNKPAVGVDVGIRNFLTSSDGEVKIRQPETLKILRKKVKYLKKAGFKKSAGKASRKLARCRKDFSFKLSGVLTRNYGVIVRESLSLAKMVKGNPGLADNLRNVAIGSFFLKLEQKAIENGCVVIQVNPAYTSQICSRCGVSKAKKLSEDTHRCKDCGLEICRDLNAARNILAKAELAGTLPVTLDSTSVFV